MKPPLIEIPQKISAYWLQEKTKEPLQGNCYLWGTARPWGRSNPFFNNQDALTQRCIFEIRYADRMISLCLAALYFSWSAVLLQALFCF
jgi:hypothetical protein